MVVLKRSSVFYIACTQYSSTLPETGMVHIPQFGLLVPCSVFRKKKTQEKKIRRIVMTGTIIAILNTCTHKR